MARMVVCPRCRERKEHHAKGLCATCYREWCRKGRPSLVAWVSAVGRGDWMVMGRGVLKRYVDGMPTDTDLAREFKTIVNKRGFQLLGRLTTEEWWALWWANSYPPGGLAEILLEYWVRKDKE